MFDSLSELIEKIYLSEDATIEFKRELPHRNSLADEIAAFANAKGGVILIGVDNSGEFILNESETLSGKVPIYELFDEELRLTIFAAKSG